ncbi:ATP-binding protein [Streptomyces sp. NPDC008343]|uniref:ATP-binding protein n=1 Tax=Streptomyces sp. NPDC008343 TaxID=3364828 RepID=UPI0036EED275
MPFPQGPASTAAPCAWGLPHRPESSRAARRITRIALTSWGIDEDSLQEALLVVSELVTNAIEHGLPPVALHLTRLACGGTVHIEVDDGGPAAVEGAWTASCSDEEHGRGSGITDSLAAARATRCSSRGATTGRISPPRRPDSAGLARPAARHEAGLRKPLGACPSPHRHRPALR